MNINPEKVGKFLKHLRGKMTQDELAEKLGLTRDSISKWERGISLPGPEALLKLSEIFNVSINEIYCGQRVRKNKINTIASKVNHSIHTNKKTILYFLGIVIMLIISYGLYYFMNTYKSIELYSLAGEGKNIAIKEGYLLITKDNIYFSINRFDVKNDETILYTELNYDNKKDVKSLIINGSNSIAFFTDDFKTSKHFNIDKIKDFYNNLYLDIYYESGSKETIQIKFHKVYTNDNLIFKKTKNNNSENDFNYDFISSNYKPLINNIIEKWAKEDEIYKFINKKNKEEYISILDKDILSLSIKKGTKLIEEWYYIFGIKDGQLYYMLYDNEQNNKVKCSFKYEDGIKKEEIGNCQSINEKAKSDYFWEYIYRSI